MLAQVGRHGEGPAIDEGALEAYRSRWPYRYIRWDRRRGLFEIRQENPDTGRDERVEFVFWYVPPQEMCVGKTQEEIDELASEMCLTGDGRLVKEFRPFDMRFVERRLKEAQLFEKWGPKHYLTKTVERNNREIAERRIKHLRGEMAAGLSEIRRHFDHLTGEAEDHIHMVPVDIDL